MDKAAANRILKSATAKLQKQFGDDVFLDTVNVKNIPSISSGSLLIDKDSGIGGFPLGRISEIFGENSSGKCLTRDTLIATPKGLETIEEIFIRNNVKLSKKITTTEVKTVLYNEHYELQTTTHFSTNGIKPIIKITTASGNILKGSHNHPIRVLDSKGEIIWKKLDEIYTSHKVVSPTIIYKPVDNIVSNSDMELIKNTISKGSFERIAFLKELRIKDTSFKRAYLRLYIKTFCDIYPNKKLVVARGYATDELFVIKQILQNTFGIISHLRTLRDKSISNLMISEREFIKFQSIFYTEEEQEASPSLWSKIKHKLFPSEFKDILSKDFYNYIDPVTKIDFLGEELTFDFTLEGSPTFIANGIASHNTSLVSSTIAQAQRQYPDKKVLFIDAEQAYDLNYAKQFGVDIDPENFIFTQPGSIEESFEIMLTMAETGLFSLIVLDSVGASATLDQLRKGMDETTMGSLAKKMSEGIHKLTGTINKAQTAVIMVNQTYSKMSMYASNAKETKGGSALKFAASIRMELKKRDLVASENNKDKIIGQAIEYIFRKNKVGQPYLSNETFLYFGKGFDRNREIIDIALATGLITRGGAWYNFTTCTGEELRFQGKEKVIEYLSNSPDDLAMFEKAVLEGLKTHDELEQISAIDNEED